MFLQLLDNKPHFTMQWGSGIAGSQFCSFLPINRGDRVTESGPILCDDLVRVRLDSGSNILLLMLISLGQPFTQSYSGPRPDPTLALHSLL